MRAYAYVSVRMRTLVTLPPCHVCVYLIANNIALCVFVTHVLFPSVNQLFFEFWYLTYGYLLLLQLYVHTLNYKDYECYYLRVLTFCNIIFLIVSGLMGGISTSETERNIFFLI